MHVFGYALEPYSYWALHQITKGYSAGVACMILLPFHKNPPKTYCAIRKRPPSAHSA